MDDKIIIMSNIDYIIVGLGNPGRQYEKTRHNIGFMALDYIANKLGVEINSDKFKGLCGYADYNGKKVILLKPCTYMNLSGASVLAAMSFYKIPPERVILIFDDISLSVGKIRVRKKGSHGGHNGVKNIIAMRFSGNFPRVKIGVGSKPNENWELSDWVLSKFNKEELEIINESIQNAYESVCLIMDEKTDEAMNKFN